MKSASTVNSHESALLLFSQLRKPQVVHIAHLIASSCVDSNSYAKAALNQVALWLEGEPVTREELKDAADDVYHSGTCYPAGYAADAAYTRYTEQVPRYAADAARYVADLQGWPAVSKIITAAITRAK